MKNLFEKITTNTTINKLLYLIFSILTLIIGFKTLLLITTIVNHISNKIEFNPTKAILNTLLHVTTLIILILITKYLKDNDELNNLRDTLGLNEKEFNIFLENEKDEK